MVQSGLVLRIVKQSTNGPLSGLLNHILWVLDVQYLGADS